MVLGMWSQTYSQLRLSASISFHSFLCCQCIGTADHLDKRMALLPVHDTGLDLTEPLKGTSQFWFGASVRC